MQLLASKDNRAHKAERSTELRCGQTRTSCKLD